MSLSLIHPKARHKARIFAFQALYQVHFNPLSGLELAQQFQSQNDYHKHVEWPFFSDLIAGVFTHQTAIDTQLVGDAAVQLNELSVLHLAVFRLALFELCYRPEIPYPVVIDEYVAIIKAFGSDEAPHFINAVLDKLAKKVRPHG